MCLICTKLFGKMNMKSKKLLPVFVKNTAFGMEVLILLFLHIYHFLRIFIIFACIIRFWQKICQLINSSVVCVLICYLFSQFEVCYTGTTALLHQHFYLHVHHVSFFDSFLNETYLTKTITYQLIQAFVISVVFVYSCCLLSSLG